ncbi:MAG: hypothetical protein LBU38_05770, partial [Propionibacteriaceae bacterium]|nr:hypothetical protein [Propionibacteriaceae bacterium]
MRLRFNPLRRRLLPMLLVLALCASGSVEGGAALANAWPANPKPPQAIAQIHLIDAHLGYRKQTTCNNSAKPGTTALLKLLIATWGGSSSGISRACAAGTTSEHKEGRALDWRMDVKNKSQKARVAQAVKWLTANNGEVAYRLGIMYIIW